MKTQRKQLGLILLGVFLAYFSASFIFVPEAPPLKEVETSIVKLESNDENVGQGLFRAASEQSEDAVKVFGDYTVSFLESFHTVVQQNQLESLQNSCFHKIDRYLSLRQLLI
ncbi:MAG TPA: hypothetical protein VFE50_23025 [Cyclobacteriaceae bacterium]|nr:hypothetical protein [Cyclobacteriaceae bacterium]